jgi:hypothetical protein
MQILTKKKHRGSGEEIVFIDLVDLVPELEKLIDRSELVRRVQALGKRLDALESNNGGAA